MADEGEYVEVELGGPDGKTWNKEAALEKAARHSRMADRVIAAQWVYHTDLVVLSDALATAKANYERLRGKHVVRFRAAGETSAEVAKMRADDVDEVFKAKVSWLTLQELVRADKEALKILHGRLDDLRTQAADHRAAGAWEARS